MSVQIGYHILHLPNRSAFTEFTLARQYSNHFYEISSLVFQLPLDELPTNPLRLVKKNNASPIGIPAAAGTKF